MNNQSIPNMHAERKITIRSHKHSFTSYPSLSPYSQMDRITDGGTNTLAVHGLEDLFSSCAVLVSRLWREILVGIFLPTIPVVPFFFSGCGKK